MWLGGNGERRSSGPSSGSVASVENATSSTELAPTANPNAAIGSRVETTEARDRCQSDTKLSTQRGRRQPGDRRRKVLLLAFDAMEIAGDGDPLAVSVLLPRARGGTRLPSCPPATWRRDRRRSPSSGRGSQRAAESRRRRARGSERPHPQGPARSTRRHRSRSRPPWRRRARRRPPARGRPIPASHLCSRKRCRGGPPRPRGDHSFGANARRGRHRRAPPHAARRGQPIVGQVVVLADHEHGATIGSILRHTRGQRRPRHDDRQRQQIQEHRGDRAGRRDDESRDGADSPAPVAGHGDGSVTVVIGPVLPVDDWVGGTVMVVDVSDLPPLSSAAPQPAKRSASAAEMATERGAALLRLPVTNCAPHVVQSIAAAILGPWADVHR